jgi:hypothetical protein
VDKLMQRSRVLGAFSPKRLDNRFVVHDGAVVTVE